MRPFTQSILQTMQSILRYLTRMELSAHRGQHLH